jgi:hypothetical protein
MWEAYKGEAEKPKTKQQWYAVKTINKEVRRKKKKGDLDKDILWDEAVENVMQLQKFWSSLLLHSWE